MISTSHSRSVASSSNPHLCEPCAFTSIMTALSQAVIDKIFVGVEFRFSTSIAAKAAS
jgi:hypothetical protein